MPQFRLFTEIIGRSVAESWNDARLEWQLREVYEAEVPETCLCSHFPIIELCVLRNRHNGNVVTVGNCCVKKFIGLPSGRIFDAIKRIRTDTSRSLNKEAIQYAFDKFWINKWERDFYENVARKRSLTEKQRGKKEEINERVLRQMKK